uniref:Uncharacterized protein n=1 Tax=Rhizophora mucronata TaxID=61149 RepID=A0A2P2QXV6_RHIMU
MSIPVSDSIIYHRTNNKLWRRRR